MLIASGSLGIVVGVALVLFARQVAGLFVQIYRTMGGEVSGPEPIPLFSVAYRVIGAAQIGLGAILIYKGLRP
jgi:hypothetical protein